MYIEQIKKNKGVVTFYFRYLILNEYIVSDLLIVANTFIYKIMYNRAFNHTSLCLHAFADTIHSDFKYGKSTCISSEQSDVSKIAS